MDRAYAALGRFVVRFRYLIVIAWVAITIVCAIALPTLNSAIKSTSFFAFLPASAPSSQAAKLAAPFQNTQYASAIIVAVRSNGPLTSADQATIVQLEGLVRAMPHVKTVSDLSTSPDGVARQIPTGCATSCRFQAKWLQTVCRRFHGCYTGRELQQRSQQAM